MSKKDIIKTIVIETNVPYEIANLIFMYWHSCISCRLLQKNALEKCEMDQIALDCCEANNDKLKCRYCKWHEECCDCWAMLKYIRGKAGSGKATELLV